MTQILHAAQSGDRAAHQQLWELVYAELHGLARRQAGREGVGWTLQPTALVHEAFMKLMGGTGIRFESSRHFFNTAALAMRRIRVDYARKGNTAKRGGPPPHARPLSQQSCEPGKLRTDLPAGAEGEHADVAQLLDLDAALGALEREQPDLAEIVHLRYFAGLSGDDTARLLGLAPRTVDKRWRLARAWLRGKLGDDSGE